MGKEEDNIYNLIFDKSGKTWIIERRGTLDRTLPCHFSKCLIFKKKGCWFVYLFVRSFDKMNTPCGDTLGSLWSLWGQTQTEMLKPGYLLKQAY